MYNNKGESKMTKENSDSDHIAVLSELTTLYKLKNEIQNKIDVADKVNEEMKVLLRKKEETDDEIPF